jgi:hypothetical protein
MVANDYLRREDTPDMSDPKTALEMYEQQVAGLAGLDVADSAMTDIHNLLQSAWEQTTDTKMKTVINDAYAKANALFAMVANYSATMNGAEVAMTAIIAQRDELTREIADLLDAIYNKNEAHPKMREWIESVRDDAYESAYESASEELAENEYENVGIEYGQGYDEGFEAGKKFATTRVTIQNEICDLAGSLGLLFDGEQVAYLMDCLLGNAPMDEAQAEVVERLFVVFGGEVAE